jgi:hypothetical protein
VDDDAISINRNGGMRCPMAYINRFEMTLNYLTS